MAGPRNTSNAPQQRRGSPSTTLETRSSEAPWMRDHRRTPRSARSSSRTGAPGSNPFESPAGQRGAIDNSSNSNRSSNTFAATPVRGNTTTPRSSRRSNMNPFDSPDVIQQQQQQRRNMNPFDSPSPSSNGNGGRTMITTTVTPVPSSGGRPPTQVRTNPFESPTPSRSSPQLPKNGGVANPFDSPAPSTSSRPPVTPNRQRSYNPVSSPAKQESVALDSLEQILDTTDETTTDDEETEVLQKGAQQQQQAYPYPPYHDATTNNNNNNNNPAFSPSPFRTPTPSAASSEVTNPAAPSPFGTPSTRSSTKKTTRTPPTVSPSHPSSVGSSSWAAADASTSQDTTPSDRALRAAETLRRNFEHRRRRRQGKAGDDDEAAVASPFQKDHQHLNEEEEEDSTTLDGLMLEYSKTEDSPRNTTNTPAAPFVGADGFPEEKKFEEENDDEEMQMQTPTNSGSTEELLPSQVDDAANFMLHDLCDEARTTDDLAWRNALALLCAQPQIASQQEPECDMTPLHVACLAHEPPPLWMTRGLLYTCPSACRQTDNGGRLPLHLLVATSADVETMRLLVEEYPPSVAHKDDRGFTPLQLLLKNDQVELTLEHLRLLLGQLSYGTSGSTSTRKRFKMLFRKGDHLKSTIEELEELDRERDEVHESTFREYPDDVRRALTKLSQWKRRQDNKAHAAKRERDAHTKFLRAKEKEFENPASIPTPTGQLLPLHLLVRRRVKTEPRHEIYGVKEATHEDLLRVLIAAYPQGLVGTDAHGKTPIMTAMLQTDFLADAETIDILLGLRTPGFNSWNRERPALIPSGDTGQLPLHVAAEELLSDYNLLSTICEAYPDARMVQDFRGRTPLHLALQNYRSVPIDEATLSLLYVDSVAKVKDNDGNKPFDLMVVNPKCVRQSPRLSNGVKYNSQVFQDFLDASMERPRNKREADSFLHQFRELPPWLRRQACAAGSVQDTLLQEIASPFNTFRILGSGFVLVVLLALLRRLLHVNDDLRDLIYYLAAYHLTIQVIYWGTTLYMGECFRLCFTNVWRWVDLAAGVLSIWCAHEVGLRSNGGSGSEDLVSNLGAAATAACWLSLLGYLVDWWCGVAVFVGSATQLLSVLIWPLCVAAMGIIATSQVLYTLEDCAEGGVCSLSDAYTLVYFMILGEPVLADDYDTSRSMWATIVVFTILWIWWIFSTVAMVVTEAKQLNRKQIAVTCYWEPKVVLTVMASNGTKDKLSDNSPASCGERLLGKMESSWNILSSALQGEKSETLWNSCCLRTRTATFFTAFLALIILPVWLALGLVTLGLLWPPQVRRWIFCPSNACDTSSGRRRGMLSTEDELTRAKLSQLRADIVELKAVAYDQNYQIQKDLGFLKDVIFRAVMDEEEEVRHAKIE